MNFWRTEYWLEYLLNSRLSNPFIDRSFYHNGVLVPVLECGLELHSPGFDDDKQVLSLVKEIALQNGIKQCQK